MLRTIVALIALLPLSAYAADFGSKNTDRLLDQPQAGTSQPQQEPPGKWFEPSQQQPPQQQPPQQAPPQQAGFPLIGHQIQVQYNNDPRLTFIIAYISDDTLMLKYASGKIPPIKAQYSATELAPQVYMVFFYEPEGAQSVTHIYDLNNKHVWANITRINTSKRGEEFAKDPLDLWDMEGEITAMK